MSAQMLAVGFSVSVAGAEASYYDREGDFWEGFNVRIHSRHNYCAHRCTVMLSARNLRTQRGMRRKGLKTPRKTNPIPVLNIASSKD
jgi:hypothetical protein